MENNNEITDEYDKEFINLIMEIEKKSSSLNKYDQLRVRNWCKKLCQVTNNIEWKKNRNLHAICILDGVLNKHFEDPYNKFPGDGPVPILSKTLVKSKLSKKFIKNSEKIQNELNSIENINKYEELQRQNQQQISPQQNINNNNNNNNKKNNIPFVDNFGEIQYDNIVMKNKANNNDLKEYINILETKLKEKDKEIDKLKEDKKKLEKRVEEIEKMLNSLMEMEK